MSKHGTQQQVRGLDGGAVLIAYQGIVWCVQSGVLPAAVMVSPASCCPQRVEARFYLMPLPVAQQQRNEKGPDGSQPAGLLGQLGSSFGATVGVAWLGVRGWRAA